MAQQAILAGAAQQQLQNKELICGAFRDNLIVAFLALLRVQTQGSQKTWGDANSGKPITAVLPLFASRRRLA